MPQSSTRQTQMDIRDGLGVNVDADGMIDNISLKLNVVAKTEDYTVKREESGTVFLTTAATQALEFTLPAVEDGLCYWFMAAVDYDLKVTGAANLLVAFNDITATSVSFATASEIVGCGFFLVSDGTKWHAFCMPGQDSATVTIA